MNYVVNPYKMRKNKYTGINSILDDIFNSSLSDLIGGDQVASTSPAVNVVETKDGFKLEVSAPGYKKEDFDIDIKKDQLILSVDKKAESEDADKPKYLRREFNYTSFKRSFHLSNKVNKEGISASYEEGILIVSLPKKEEAKEMPPRKIEIL